MANHAARMLQLLRRRPLAPIFAGGASGGDVTAPVLTNPIDDADGLDAGTGSVDTDEGNGTLYFVVTQSATSPSAAQVKAGQDHLGTAADDSGSQAVSGTGTQAISGGFTGLTASTGYWAHYMHEDAATNQSSVSSADGFTTDAVFSPSDLWLAAENGDWFDPSDLSTMWQTEDTSTPVTASGQSVGRIVGKINGHVLVQATAANRPTYIESGGLHYLSFDGGDRLAKASATGMINASDGSHTAIAGALVDNTTGTKEIVSNDGGGTGSRVSQMLRTSGAVTQSIAFNTASSPFTDSGPNVTASVAFVISELTASAAVEVFKDGVGDGSTAITGTMTTNQNQWFALGSAAAGTSQFLTGRIYQAIIIGRALSSGERASAEQWCADKAGVTL